MVVLEVAAAQDLVEVVDLEEAEEETTKEEDVLEDIVVEE